jgi:2-phospho-L-lactate/phosphoenolpyruvate guanylyltransferase
VTAARIYAVVPAKDLGRAKERLAGLLSAEERRGLARAMLEDLLKSLAAVPALAGILVVTRDAELAALARAAGAGLVSDLRHEGPTGAIALAASRLAAAGADGMLAVPADVPLATPGEIAEILAAGAAAPAVTLVPALADMGTNAIALWPPDAIPPHFGPQSFFRHQELALARGIEPRILRLSGLGLDIDRPEDVAAFMALPSATRSYAYLAECGIIERLRRMGPPGAHDAGQSRNRKG